MSEPSALSGPAAASDQASGPATASEVLLVGAGPRAVAVAARLIADHEASGSPRLTIHLLDSHDVGAGRTWRRDQSRWLINNTYCAETAVFADETIPTVGPTRPGPSLDEWLLVVREHPDDFEPWVVQEALRSEPWSYPSRPLQGVYYRWALGRVLDDAPEGLNFVEHVGEAVSLDPAPDGHQTVTLADGTQLHADYVVLAQGFQPSANAPEVLALARDARARGFTYVAPGLPAEREWDLLPAGQDVLVRGLGGNFFDLIGVLFEGRGGRFERVAGRLRYVPSGREPHVIAGSRHGVPYRSKSHYPTGMPVHHELRRFSAQRERELLEEHRDREDVDAVSAVVREILADFQELYEQVAAREGVGERFDWRRIVHPTDGVDFPDEASWQAFLDAYFRSELFNIEHPAASPHKAVHQAMETARRRISRLVLARVFEPFSVMQMRHEVLADSLVLASGPPPERTERLIALREAGLVEILGPDIEIEPADEGFVATTRVPGQRRLARALVEAWMSIGDIRSTADPLIRQLLDSGQARFYTVTAPDGTPAQGSTLDVTRDRFLLIDAQGRPNERCAVLGPPAGDVQFNAAIGAIPHTGDKLLAGAELVAAEILRTLGEKVPLGGTFSPSVTQRTAASTPDRLV